MVTNYAIFNISKMYQDMLDAGDPRVATWPMMDSPVKGLTLVVMYLGFVKVAGPALMRDQKPYDLRYIMAIYNFALVAVSAWMFINFGMLGWFTTYSWRCEPVDYSNSPDAVRMAEIGWYFYITKFIEFADTIFFVLRKKDSQISSLHVFHHSVVPLTLWFGIKYAPGGYNSIFAFLNSFVHTLMYLYYGLSALGPSFQKYLWWKKYLTVIQMAQFTLVFVFMFQLTFFPKCHVSKPMLILNVAQAIIFFAMFLNFFRGSYRKRQRRASKDFDSAAQQTCSNTTRPATQPSSTNNNDVVAAAASVVKPRRPSQQQQQQNGYVHHRKVSVHSELDSSLKYLDVNYITEAVTISA